MYMKAKVAKLTVTFKSNTMFVPNCLKDTSISQLNIKASCCTRTEKLKTMTTYYVVNVIYKTNSGWKI